MFGFVRQCIFKEQRNIYFAFDSSWMDRILLSESKVHVTILNANNIRDTLMPSLQSLPETESDETFQIIYSELKSNLSAIITPLACNKSNTFLLLILIFKAET